MTDGTYCDPDKLVSMMRAGDLNALERITHCYGNRLLAVGRRHCRNEDEAADAVQDALLASGEHLQDFRGDGSPEGWLIRMVSNACNRMRRGRKNDPTLHVDVADSPLVDTVTSPENLAGRAELVEALGEALLDLPPKDRAILLLAEAEGWTGPEIAKSLAMTPTAVRVRLTRIRAKMRPRLEHLRQT